MRLTSVIPVEGRPGPQLATEEESIHSFAEENPGRIQPGCSCNWQQSEDEFVNMLES